ncbi:hypothetical protein FRC03_003855, partial [Tulasnella sp. 419]
DWLHRPKDWFRSVLSHHQPFPSRARASSPSTVLINNLDHDVQRAVSGCRPEGNLVLDTRRKASTTTGPIMDPYCDVRASEIGFVSFEGLVLNTYKAFVAQGGFHIPSTERCLV